jgi:hypothetical protein
MQTIRWLRVFRDVAMVWAIGILGATLFIMTGNRATASESNTLWGTVGFFVVGCMTKENRLRHIAAVGAVYWLTEIINIPLFGVSVAYWFGSIFVTSLKAALGGGISNFFVNRKPRL